MKTLWKKWLTIAHVVGNFQAIVIFTLFYFLILFPMGIVMRLLDPLNIKKKKKSTFNTWQHPDWDLEKAQKPY